MPKIIKKALLNFKAKIENIPNLAAC